MLRRALLLKVVSWIVLSPAYAMAQPPQPLHCRADVRGFMLLAWQTVKNGTVPYEAVFLVKANGEIDWKGSSHEFNKMHVVVPPGTIALFHTHPNAGEPGLSPTDKASADQKGIVIYAITNKGLYRYSHPLGESLVRPDMEWSKACQ